MHKLTATLGFIALVLPGCAAEMDDDPNFDDRAAEINTFIGDLPQLELPDLEPKTPVECQVDCPEDGQEEDLMCTYQSYRETQRFSEFVAFQPNSAALWPGSIVQGAEAKEGFFTPVGVDRGPLTFSLSLENLSGSPVAHMDDPSLSAFREERNNILAAGVTGATPASIDFEVTEIHSSSQVSIALGASVMWPGGAAVTAGFNFDSSEKKTKILVNYTQAYYTIDIDTPIEPKDFFGPNVTVEELVNFMDTDNPPVYVQSITYGRRVIFSVESNESADKIKVALEAAYEASIDVEANLAVEYENILEQSTIRAFVLGGSGAEAAGAISGFEGLLQYISKGGDYSKDSPGAPIAYKLAYLDNAVTKFAFTTEYAERMCTVNRGDLHAELSRIDHIGGGDAGSEIEFYGNVSVRYPTEDSPVISCDEGGEIAHLLYLEDGQWFNMDEYSSYTPTSSTYIDFESLPVGDGEKICLFAEFWEEDFSTGEFSGDDYYGYHERLVDFATGWGGNHVLQPRGDSQNAVDVHLTLRLDE